MRVTREQQDSAINLLIPIIDGYWKDGFTETEAYDHISRNYANHIVLWVEENFNASELVLEYTKPDQIHKQTYGYCIPMYDARNMILDFFTETVIDLRHEIQERYEHNGDDPDYSIDDNRDFDAMKYDNLKQKL